ncbi:hypothetical protein KGQ19_37440 [Catenulispora sp. NL8]|uniref:Uncharacterized protein n=1 Tax=Catenulispora pinistramenti TaxID=2705254 RepID=A0ABS5L338_9ACTN|nr:hypothetical protein [Catenulispora pinistramenti]MBS2552555.1 hypothetical protein [Catenulispora pinistramenti]
MSEYGVGRDQVDTTAEPVPAGEPGDLVAEGELIAEPVEEPVEEYADPQEWIGGLISALERAEQGIGSGPRDALMARIKLAQAYSELGDTVQAAPLAVTNVAQARVLFPSSEGMLRQLREFRDAACEAAGWTAAMMREPEAPDAEAFEQPSELVSRAAAVAAAAETNESAMPYDPAEDFSAERVGTGIPAAASGASASAATTAAAAAASPSAGAPTAGSPAASTPATGTPAANFAAEPDPAAAVTEGHQFTDPEPAGAVIHEFVRRPQEPDALQWAAEVQAALTQPAELAIPTPPEPEYAEEVEPALASADLADLSDLADLAAIEEIIRLRYELREAQRTIERLRHVNRKLREALEFDQEP